MLQDEVNFCYNTTRVVVTCRKRKAGRGRGGIEETDTEEIIEVGIPPLMDWDTKIPYWDLPELERGCEPNIRSVAFNPTSAGHDRQKSVMDCSVDLKLGGLGDFGSSSRWTEPQKATTPAASPPGPSKRARTPNNGSHIASCLVDGCKSDLSNCRDYHRRHKVCETHSKTPIVFVGGQEQRFCQQCSRFHLLVEFDDVKRSCRKRLDGHNRRRRKPQIDPINSGFFHPNLQGSRFSSYSHMFPAMVPDPPNWSSSVVEDEANDHHKLSSPLHFINRQQSFPGSYTRSYIEGNRFPFLQDNDIGNTISFSGSSRNNSGKLFSAGLTPVLDSDCALSLLSSSTRASSINTNHMVPADQIPVAQPMPHSQQQYGFGRFSRSQSLNNVSPTGFSCSGFTDRHVSTVLVSDASNADLQCSSIFQVDGERSNNGPSTVLPFPWSS